MKTTKAILASMTPEQRRDFEYLKTGFPAAQKALDDRRRRQGLATIARLERWLATQQRR